jgi:molybdate transport repressor ModE-like protein
MNTPQSNRFVRSYLKTRHLTLLAELGHHGSISRAAQAARLTQPSASKLLAELEQVLGIPLFERSRHGVVPTWYGEVLIRRAGASLAEMDAAYQELMTHKHGQHQHVSIGAVLTPSTTLVPRAVSLLKSRFSDIDVTIAVDNSKKLIEDLCGGRLDIAIGRIPDSAATAELNFEPIADEPHCLVVRPGHPLLLKGCVGLEELSEEAWVFPPYGSVLRERVVALFLTHGISQPRDVVTTSTFPVVVALTLSRDLVAPVSSKLAQPYIDNGSLVAVRFELNLHMDTYGIVTRRQHHLSPAGTSMLEVFRELILDPSGRGL